MQGLRRFIHHPNRECVAHPTTLSLLQAIDGAMDTDEPAIVALLGKPGVGKTRLVNYWASEYQAQDRGMTTEHRPVVVAEVDETESARLPKGVYTTPTACVTFSSIIYGLAEIALRHDGPQERPRWYREEQSLYTDRPFLWLFDQVCFEVKRLGVRTLIIDNAQRLDVPTMRALLKLRKRRNNHLGIVLSAQLAAGEGLDEPLGKLFSQAKVDPADCEAALELKPLDEGCFNSTVLQALLADLEAPFAPDLVPHAAFIATTLWTITAGDWHSRNSRIKHFNRLLGPRTNPKRCVTREFVEQVLGRTLPPVAPP